MKIDDVLFVILVGEQRLRIGYEAHSKLPSCESGRVRCQCRMRGLFLTFVSSMN